MKKIKFFLPILAIILFFASCTVSPQKGREVINTTKDDIVSQYQSFLTSQQVEVAKTLGYLLNQYTVDTVSKKSLPIAQRFNVLSETQKIINFENNFIQKQILEPLKNANFKSVDDCNMTVSDIAGTLNWNASKKVWEFTEKNPSDKLIINFPSDSTSTENNVTITVNKVIVSDCRPELLNFTIIEDGKTIMTFDGAVSYDNDGLPIQANLDSKIGKLHLTYEHNYDKTNRHITLTANISEGLSTYEDVNVDLYLTSEDTYPDHGEISLRLFDLKIDASLKFQGVDWNSVINYDDNQTVSFLNQYTKIEFKTKTGRHIADGIWAINDGDIDLKIVFKDDSYEWGSNELEDLADRLEKVTEDYLD